MVVKAGLMRRDIRNLFDIYKEQELIKNKLEEQLKNMMSAKDKENCKKSITTNGAVSEGDS